MSRDISTGNFLQLAPLAPVFTAFALGILTGDWAPLPRRTLYIFILISFIPPSIAFFRGRRFSFFIIIPIFFFIGALFIRPYGPGLLPPSHITRSIDDSIGAGKRVRPLYDVTGLVISEPVFTGRYTRLVVSARSLFKDGQRQDASGGIRLTVRGRTRGIERGDVVRFLGHLKLPHNFGNPGEFNYVRWLRARGVSALGSVRSPRWIIRLRHARPGILTTSARARRGINTFIDASGAANQEILKALVTGDKRGLSNETRLAFSRAGVAHVLVISGLHVGIVAFFTYSIIIFFLKLCPFLTLRTNVKKTALLLSLIPVLGYGFMAGFSRPTERAVIMAIALIIAVTMDRGKSLYNTLAMAALIILVLAPTALFEASFQLSFLAVFFILYLSPLLFSLFIRDAEDDLKPVATTAESWIWSRVRWTKNIFAFIDKDDVYGKKTASSHAESGFLARGRFILSIIKIRALGLFVVTVAASLGTWPVVAYYFNHVSTVGIFSNLIILPITTVLVEAVFLSAVLIPISATLAGWGFHLAGAIAGVQLFVVRAFAGISISSIHISMPSPLEIFLIYIFIFCLFSINKGRFFRYITAISAVVLIAVIAYPHVAGSGSPGLKVTFVSVGQGDAALVEFPRGAVMLIDGGGFRGGGGKGGFDTGKSIIAPLLRYKKIRRVDYMVLSHAQQDHMGGLRYVAANFPLGAFWWNGLGYLGRLGEALLDKGAPMSRLGREKKTFFIEGVKVEVMPLAPDAAVGINDKSLVLRVSYGSRSFLFTGDVEALGEGYLSAMRNMRADVLKAPHHGSDTSSTAAFLRAVRPRIVVISVGRGNRFGFPAAQSLERYARAGALVFRTDRDGAVEFTTDGRDLEVKTYGD